MTTAMAYIDFQEDIDTRVVQSVLRLSMNASAKEVFAGLSIEELLGKNASNITNAFRDDARGYCRVSWWYWLLAREASMHARFQFYARRCALFAPLLTFFAGCALRDRDAFMLVTVMTLVSFMALRLLGYRLRAKKADTLIDSYLSDFHEEFWRTTSINQEAIRLRGKRLPKDLQARLFAARSSVSQVQEAKRV